MRHLRVWARVENKKTRKHESTKIPHLNPPPSAEEEGKKKGIKLEASDRKIGGFFNLCHSERIPAYRQAGEESLDFIHY